MIKEYTLSNGIQVKVRIQKRCESNKYFNNGMHDIYKVIFQFPYGVFNRTYHNSPNNYKKPLVDVDKVVNSILTDFMAYKTYPNINDFFHNYGYDFDNYEEYQFGIKIFKSCCDTYVRLGQLVTSEEVMELIDMTKK